jgi:hypothetical protein
VVKKVADEDKELLQLKALYDELWSDARSMIKDMNKSVFVYLFAGFLSLVFSTIMIGSGIANWNKIFSGDAVTLTYVYVIAETFGSVIYVIFGITLLYWYRKLRGRYSKLIEMVSSVRYHWRGIVVRNGSFPYVWF